jgi:hypothetical protein
VITICTRIYNLSLNFNEKGIEMKYINLTPHDVIMRGANGAVISLSAERNPIRCVSTTQRVKTPYGEVQREIVYDYLVDIPEPEDDTIYIVSSRVERLCPSRSDVWYPAGFERDPITLKPLAASVLRKQQVQ